jgi:hypothetical protein
MTMRITGIEADLFTYNTMIRIAADQANCGNLHNSIQNTGIVCHSRSYKMLLACLES